jgi:hypothetical protein
MSDLLRPKPARTIVALKSWQRPTPCWCGGYWFPHRIGGGACEHSKTCDIHRAIRTGDEEIILDARLAYILKYPGKATVGAPCPF